MQSLRLANIEIESQILAEIIEQEKSAGVEHFNSIAAVTDMFSTPFFQAVRHEGYVAKLEGVCKVLRPCLRCRKHSAHIYFKDGIEVNLCPLCDRT